MTSRGRARLIEERVARLVLEAEGLGSSLSVEQGRGVDGGLVWPGDLSAYRCRIPYEETPWVVSILVGEVWRCGGDGSYDLLRLAWSRFFSFHLVSIKDTCALGPHVVRRLLVPS